MLHTLYFVICTDDFSALSVISLNRKPIVQDSRTEMSFSEETVPKHALSSTMNQENLIPKDMSLYLDAYTEISKGNTMFFQQAD
jgi:hypothetical protein